MMFVVIWCLALWFVFIVIWYKLLMTSAISFPLWSSVYVCQRVECAFTSPMRTECGVCDVLYAVLYVPVTCCVVCDCAVTRRNINV